MTTTTPLNRTLKIGSILLLVLGICTLASALIKRENAKPEKPQPFVITYQYYRGSRDSLTPTAISVKIVDPKRGWREVISYYRDCTRWEGGVMGGAYYTVNRAQDALQYRQDAKEGDESSYNTDLALRSNPAFLRTELVAGLTTFVIKGPDHDGLSFEWYYSPKTGSVPLKTVVHDGAVDKVAEAIAIQFRGVSEQELSLPKLPIRFDDAERESALFRSSGDIEQADALDESISRMKDKVRIKE